MNIKINKMYTDVELGYKNKAKIKELDKIQRRRKRIALKYDRMKKELTNRIFFEKNCNETTIDDIISEIEKSHQDGNYYYLKCYKIYDPVTDEILYQMKEDNEFVIAEIDELKAQLEQSMELHDKVSLIVRFSTETKRKVVILKNKAVSESKEVDEEEAKKEDEIIRREYDNKSGYLTTSKDGDFITFKDFYCSGTTLDAMLAMIKPLNEAGENYYIFDWIIYNPVDGRILYELKPDLSKFDLFVPGIGELHAYLNQCMENYDRVAVEARFLKNNTLSLDYKDEHNIEYEL